MSFQPVQWSKQGAIAALCTAGIVVGCDGAEKVHDLGELTEIGKADIDEFELPLHIGPNGDVQFVTFTASTSFEVTLTQPDTAPEQRARALLDLADLEGDDIREDSGTSPRISVRELSGEPTRFELAIENADPERDLTGRLAIRRLADPPPSSWQKTLPLLRVGGLEYSSAGDALVLWDCCTNDLGIDEDRRETNFARVWNTDNASLRHRHRPDLSRKPTAVVMDRGRDSLVLASEPVDGTSEDVELTRVSMASGEIEWQRFLPPDASVRSMAVSPDGTTLATVDRSGDLTLWEADGAGYAPVRSYRVGEWGNPDALAFSVDGTHLIAFGQIRQEFSRRLVTWPVDQSLAEAEAANTLVSSNPVLSLEGGRDLTSMALSPTGDRIALSLVTDYAPHHAHGDDTQRHQTHVFSLDRLDEAGHLALEFTLTDDGGALAFTPDGAVLAVGDGRERVYRSKTAEHGASHGWSNREGYVSYFDVDGEYIRSDRLYGPSVIHALAFHPDADAGLTLAVAGDSYPDPAHPGTSTQKLFVHAMEPLLR